MKKQTRWPFPTFLGVLGLLSLLGMRWIDRGRIPEHIGHPIVCSDKFPFKDQEAEVLQYGLTEVRGLASDSSRNLVFIQEADRSLLLDWNEDSPASKGGTETAHALQFSEKHTTCHSGSCDADDPRGLAILDHNLYSADSGLNELTRRAVPEKPFPAGKSGTTWWEDSKTEVQGEPQILAQLSGIAAAGDKLFVLHEYRAPLPAVDSPGAIPISRTTTSNPTSGYELLALSNSSQRYTSEQVATNLTNASGVTAASSDGPVIVAESDDAMVHWPVFERKSGHWLETRSFGAIRVEYGRPTPKFLSLAVNAPWGMVFASGPGGLYVFDLYKRTLLGRVMFDDPVDAVTSNGNLVFLAVGHTLVSLTLRAHPIKPPSIPSEKKTEPPVPDAPPSDSNPEHPARPQSGVNQVPPGKRPPPIKPSKGSSTPPVTAKNCPCISAGAK